MVGLIISGVMAVAGLVGNDNFYVQYPQSYSNFRYGFVGKYQASFRGADPLNRAPSEALVEDSCKASFNAIVEFTTLKWGNAQVSDDVLNIRIGLAFLLYNKEMQDYFIRACLDARMRHEKTGTVYK